MLLQLSIRNFALIDDISLEFEGGLNILTGETGAGKSILIDALRLVLGERAQGDLHRVKDAPCIIEAAFSVPGFLRNTELLSEFLDEGDDMLIFRREVTPEGRSRNTLNRRIVNVSVLREIGGRLIDFHGQHDQQRIFDVQAHLELVDRLCGLRQGAGKELREAYRKAYANLRELEQRKKEIIDAGETRQRQIDLLSYQIQEIEKISPKAGEEEELRHEKIRLSHAQRLFDLTREILDLLDEGEDAAAPKLGRASRAFQSWTKIDPSADAFSSQMEEAQITLEELVRSVRDYREGLSFEEGRLDGIEDRLAGIENLKRKYGGSIEKVLEFLASSRQDLDRLENAELYQRDVENEIAKVLPELTRSAEEMTRLRKKAARQLKKEVESELRDLGLPHAEFECRISPVEFSAEGRDHVEFYFSPNPGLGLKPLAEIASGGEASRILLALKRALAAVDETPTLVFDEIDANIGGRLGETVGRKLREIGEERQVLLITHLPQIASFARRHFKVMKKVARGETSVSYHLLEGEERVRELAQMMSGERESGISRSHAKEMLKTASK